MELILDYKTWRSGVSGGINGINKVGEGDTLLLNSEGYRCCLGQFAPQINKDITDEHLLGQGTPEDINILCNPLTEEHDGAIWNEELEKWVDGIEISDTRLSDKAITINDDSNTTPAEKIVKLRKLFNEYGYTIRVINAPENSGILEYDPSTVNTGETAVV